MDTLSLDIETFSTTDIKDAGVYRYTEDPAFTILLLTYGIDRGTPVNIDLTIDYLPDWLIEAILDPAIEKWAYNAAFERRCLSIYLKRYLPPEQWHCTMIKAAMVGLPFGLDNVCKALKLDQGKKAEGKALIKYFCSPCKPTKVNGGRTRNLPHHAPDKWEAFISYNVNDVVLENIIDTKIDFYQVPDTERELWALDQKMNDKGVKLDTRLIEAAIMLDENNGADLIDEAKRLTGLDNPNSGAQLKKWIGENCYYNPETLTKGAVKDMLDIDDLPDNVKRVLQIRQELAKTSNKKWPAMLDCIGEGDRVRGLLQFYGAGRTGRWAGRLIQPQNLPQSQLNDADLDIARNLVLAGDSDGINLMFGNIPDTLSQLIRTALIPEEGKRFIVCDLSSIEARIIAWLSGEKWRLDVFATHGKIYEASAAAMFKVPIESVTKGSPMRQKGKIAELALGYQGGVNALKTMGAIEMGIPEDDLQGLVYAWRNANKKIVQYWYDIQRAALDCVRTRSRTTVGKVEFKVEKGVLFIMLPSGRKLAYLRPSITAGTYGDVVSYEGVIQATKQWGRIDSYGGKFVENIVQAIARDVLADGMLRLDKAGLQLVLSVHDEVIIEDSEDFVNMAEAVSKIMSAPIPWAKNLPLGADGFESKYYKK